MMITMTLYTLASVDMIPKGAHYIADDEDEEKSGDSSTHGFVMRTLSSLREERLEAQPLQCSNPKLSNHQGEESNLLDRSKLSIE